jgi:hypothetical protein
LLVVVHVRIHSRAAGISHNDPLWSRFKRRRSMPPAARRLGLANPLFWLTLAV